MESTPSQYLNALERIKGMLSNFDMSFGVSNKFFRLAIASEILDTQRLFEYLLDAWTNQLPWGAGPGTDVDFAYWSNIDTWNELISTACQNVCIENYPVDLGNGETIDNYGGFKRKAAAKSFQSILKSARVGNQTDIHNFYKLLLTEKESTRDYGMLVYYAISHLCSTLAQINTLIDRPSPEQFQKLFSVVKREFHDNYHSYRENVRAIIREDISAKRKENQLRDLNDRLYKDVVSSDFLDVIKSSFTQYDIADYRAEHPQQTYSNEDILSWLAVEELFPDEISNDLKIAQYVFQNRKTLTQDAIKAFFVYIEVSPFIHQQIEFISCKKTQEPSIPPFVTYPEKLDEIIEKLRAYISGKSTPRDIMMPVRAAFDAGVIRKPTYTEFKLEFPTLAPKSKSSFDDYLKADQVGNQHPYFGVVAFSDMVLEFKQLKDESCIA